MHKLLCQVRNITINNIQGYIIKILDVAGVNIKIYSSVDADKLYIDLSFQTSYIYFIKISNNIEVRKSNVIIE